MAAAVRAGRRFAILEIPRKSREQFRQSLILGADFTAPRTNPKSRCGKRTTLLCYYSLPSVQRIWPLEKSPARRIDGSRVLIFHSAKISSSCQKWQPAKPTVRRSVSAGFRGVRTRASECLEICFRVLQRHAAFQPPDLRHDLSSRLSGPRAFACLSGNRSFRGP